MRTTKMLLAVFVVMMLTATVVVSAADPIDQGTPSPAPTVRETSAALPPININKATAAELATLPGIGLHTAERIVAYRNQNGPFRSIDELLNVKGIGIKRLERIRARLTIK